MVSIFRSSGLISMSTSSASGSTATVAAEVWMRPCASVSGTRCTRCTPDSNFSLANGAAAADFRDDFLEAALGALAHRHDLGLPALLGGVALVHAEQVAGEQRGLVAAGAGADFQDHVALVHRVLGQQREAQLLASALRGASSSAGCSASAMSRMSASVFGIGDHRVQLGDLLRRRRDRPSPSATTGSISANSRDSLTKVSGGDLARQLGLDQRVAVEQRVELRFRQRGHS